MNKIGSEKLLSIWWFLVLIIVMAGIVGGVVIYYSADFDVRSLEAKILHNRILNCLNNGGYLDSDLFDKNFDVIKECSLDRKLFDEGGDFLLKIEVFDDNGNELREAIEEGNSAFEKDCKIQAKGVKAVKNVKCFSGEEKILYFDKGEIKKGKLNVLTGSNQRARKIPIK